MTTQEQAFLNWYDNQPTFGVDYQEIWNAACSWQRERDAELILSKDVYFISEKETWYFSKNGLKQISNYIRKGIDNEYAKK